MHFSHKNASFYRISEKKALSLQFVMGISIMAIGNATPDSFYSESRIGCADAVSWAERALADGASILDIGGCSTRPGSSPVEEEEEWRRVCPVLEAIRDRFPEAALSLDTFRPEIARRALEQFGRIMINDISGGCEAMYEVVRRYGARYVWTLRGDLSLPSQRPEMGDMDLVLDPGFGFTGGVENDWRCMREMDRLQVYAKPILVGVSRKSMLYKPLGITPDSCGEATQVLHLYALEHGATILRVHDVALTAQTVRLYETMVNGKL